VNGNTLAPAQNVVGGKDVASSPRHEFTHRVKTPVCEGTATPASPQAERKLRALGISHGSLITSYSSACHLQLGPLIISRQCASGVRLGRLRDSPLRGSRAPEESRVATPARSIGG
jgi:hypothetical protein